MSNRPQQNILGYCVPAEYFRKLGDTQLDVDRKVHEFLQNPHPIEDATPIFEELIPENPKTTSWTPCIYRHPSESKDCRVCTKLICGCKECPKFGSVVTKKDCKVCPHQAVG